MSDSTLFELTKLVNSSQPCVQKAMTNEYDFLIAAVICATIVFVAFIAKCAILSWKTKIINAEKTERYDKKDKENEEAVRKQKSDLIDKLLDYLKNNVSKKNDNKGQQTKSQTLSMKPDDIYNLLQGNAAKSCSEELRQQYIELCVEVLQKLEPADNQSDNCVDGKPIDVKISGKGHQSDKTGSGASNGDSESQKTSDIYMDVLCFLIAHVEKGTLDENDLEDLRKRCGLEKEKTAPTPKTT